MIVNAKEMLEIQKQMEQKEKVKACGGGYNVNIPIELKDNPIFKAGQVDALEYFLYRKGVVSKRALKKRLREIKGGI